MAGKLMSVEAQEQKWRNEDDARTLAQAAAIQADPKRVAGAKKAATAMLKEKEKDINSLRKIAGGKPSKAPSKKK